MPALNKLDDYDACMDVYAENAKYCYVRTALKPDFSSELYKFIVEFSSKKKVHFRHDKLTRGVCINTCQQLITEMGSGADEYFVPEFELDYKVKKKLMNHLMVN